MPRRMHKGKTSRRRRINDQPKTGTNIKVSFKKVLQFKFLDAQPHPSFSVTSLSPKISALSDELAEIYKLYRFVSVNFEFQAQSEFQQALQPEYAIQYVPAEQSNAAIAASPPELIDYEGPAVGYWQNSRGRPYRYTIPSTVLNAMPLNWYETESSSTSAEDFIQGHLYISTTAPGVSSIRCLAHFTIEYQTLVAPEFISNQLSKLRELEKRENSRAMYTKRPTQTVDGWSQVSLEEDEATAMAQNKRSSSHASERPILVQKYTR